MDERGEGVGRRADRLELERDAAQRSGQILPRLIRHARALEERADHAPQIERPGTAHQDAKSCVGAPHMPRGLDQEGGVGHLGEEALQLEQAARDRGIVGARHDQRLDRGGGGHHRGLYEARRLGCETRSVENAYHALMNVTDRSRVARQQVIALLVVLRPHDRHRRLLEQRRSHAVGPARALAPHRALDQLGAGHRVFERLRDAPRDDHSVAIAEQARVSGLGHRRCERVEGSARSQQGGEAVARFFEALDRHDRLGRVVRRQASFTASLPALKDPALRHFFS